jgi:hypothetical protein
MEKNLEEECPICFEINGHNECILLDCCDKYIHKDCFERWLIYNNNNSCIYCTKNNKYIENFFQSQNVNNILITDVSINILDDIRSNNFSGSNNITETNNFIIIRNSNSRFLINCFYLSFFILILFIIFSSTILRTSLN